MDNALTHVISANFHLLQAPPFLHQPLLPPKLILMDDAERQFLLVVVDPNGTAPLLLLLLGSKALAFWPMYFCGGIVGKGGILL